ncbi:MAG: N-methylhydantoinase [Solirubrobacteraceae bacterium]|jgi:N-methylhydantoinase A|nr:N-methylhydantoinase [Solirubrobacteraceae bacterium]
MSARWHVGLDIGGTFTDVVAVDAVGGTVRHLKVPSSRSDPASGMLRGLAALADEAGVAPADVALLLHGTTLATNAIIERRLAKTALVTTEGFRDVLEIGRHWRTDLYDPFIDQPEPLVPRELRVEVDERLGADGEVLRALSPEAARAAIERLEGEGVESVAVAFLHSYRDPSHEREMTELLRAANGWYVCGSAELSRELREYERTSTTVLNAALMPLIDAYLTRVERGLEESGNRASLFISQSNGGALTPRATRTRPVSLALSGPVGGVVACIEIGRGIEAPNLIGLDMGGTSTDVSIITDYEARYSTELLVGDLPVRIPSIEVHSIGAGGGSIATVDSGGSLRVGPESAGSEPGPAAYGRGGTEATVTDCQLLLGRLTADFALAGRLTLQPELAREAIGRIATQIGMSVEDAAAGIIEVANASMERAVRVALRDRGDDPREFALVAFGGAGPLHAVELARRLSIRTVVVPPHPGTLSAVGFLASDVRLDFAASDLRRSDDPNVVPAVASAFAELEGQARHELSSDERLAGAEARLERSCDIRYLGQAYEVNVAVPEGPMDVALLQEVVTRFHAQHERAYGFSSPDDPCELVTFRVSAKALLDKPAAHRAAAARGDAQAGERQVHLGEDGYAATRIYDRSRLGAGDRIEGPAVVHQTDATTLIPSFATAEVDDRGNLIVTVPEAVA